MTSKRARAIGEEFVEAEEQTAATNVALRHGGECPGCGRIMSLREAAEQGACNDCNGGAYDPTGGER
jgi:ssDNA-binding Zn-finger/Zn-ribbon topoisomerase 1